MQKVNQAGVPVDALGVPSDGAVVGNPHEICIPTHNARAVIRLQIENIHEVRRKERRSDNQEVVSSTQPGHST